MIGFFILSTLIFLQVIFLIVWILDYLYERSADNHQNNRKIQHSRNLNNFYLFSIIFFNSFPSNV